MIDARIAVRKHLVGVCDDPKIVEKEIWEWATKDSILNKEEAYKEHAYEALGILKSGYGVNTFMAEMKEGKCGWDLAFYDKFRRKEHVPVIKDKPQDYVYFCKDKVCGAGCSIDSRQTRGGDEGMTNYAVCTNIKCQKEYVIC